MRFGGEFRHSGDKLAEVPLFYAILGASYGAILP
jgi:hypothetical protein